MHAFSIDECASAEAYTRMAASGEGDERRRRRRVRQEPVEGPREPEALAEPVHDDLLELRPNRRGPPEHRVLAEGSREHLAENARTRRGRREVGEEPRVLPV